MIGVLLLVSGGLASVAMAQSPTGSGPVAAEERKPLTPEEYARVLAKVLPEEGYTLPIAWGDLGPKLVQHGVIDLEKFRQLYGKEERFQPDLRRLEAPSEDLITITRDNAWLLVNVFWGVGLASTAGWTLGAKPPVELYSNVALIPLTPEQETLVADLAQGIYRPCCNNSTAFPDCHHGMALLGVIELMAANGLSREEILKAAVQFNALSFPQQYMQMALLFQLRGIDWDAVDPQEVLGARYSSLKGWTQHVEHELQKLASRLPPQAEGASCAVSP
jgi:hypothetical protein